MPHLNLPDRNSTKIAPQRSQTVDRVGEQLKRLMRGQTWALTDRVVEQLQETLQGNTSPTAYVLVVNMPDPVGTFAPSTPSFLAETKDAQMFQTLMGVTQAPPSFEIKPVLDRSKERVVNWRIGRSREQLKLATLAREIPRVRDDVSTDALAKIITELRSTLSASAFDTYSNLLRTLDPPALSTIALITLLRTSYPYRGFIEEWRNFLKSAETQLITRGLDTAKLLRGLAE